MVTEADGQLTTGRLVSFYKQQYDTKGEDKKTKRSVTLYNDESVIMMLIINKIICYAVFYAAMNYTFLQVKNLLYIFY